MSDQKRNINNPNPFPKGITFREVLNNHLVLEDPPPEAFKRYKASKWYMITGAIKLRPGRWYRIQVYEDSKNGSRAAGGACTRLKKEFGKQGFEFVHSENTVWGRYVGTTGIKAVTASKGSSNATAVIGVEQHDDQGVEEFRDTAGAKG